MRIGTWNLDAKWTERHSALLVDGDCDIWLLTEVVEAVRLPGYAARLSDARMTRNQHYAAVLSRSPMRVLPDPHPASAAVEIDGVTYCSSVLPWAAKDNPLVWGHGDQGVRTAVAVSALAKSLRPAQTVWGGDFNHALDGPPRWSGSTVGRQAIKDFAESLEITFATASLPHRQRGICSIDHIGIPAAWTVADVNRLNATVALSDHDAYVVTAYRT